MIEHLRGEFPPFAREGKPRERGITIVTDLMDPLDKESFEVCSEYVDFVKIGLSVPLVVEKPRLLERIRYYHDLGIRVMSGGTLIQVALSKNILTAVLERVRSLGFDMVEIAESAQSIPYETKERVCNEISNLSMEYIVEAGTIEGGKNKDPDNLIAKVEEAKKLGSKHVVIEAGENGEGVGFYGSEGEISWDVLNEIVGKFGPPNLIFEAPKSSQRVALILEFGPSVNLASVGLDEVLSLEMQRLGLTSETLGLSPSVQSVDGSPAAKFIYYLIKAEHPIDQATLTQRSGLPKRTLQAALSSLVEAGLVRQIMDMSDLRRHKYTPK